MKEQVLQRNPCRILEKGTDGPIIVWFTSEKNGESTNILWEELNRLLPDQSYILAAYSVKDWNSDLAPWLMKAPDGTFFSGNGPETLNNVKTILFPELLKRFPPNKKFFAAGYSLAGLFALWAFFETSLFSGAACCSGSLWYDGWREYIKTAVPPEGSRVYLSLGGKEADSGPEWMREIGRAYEEQEKMFKLDKRIQAVLYEKNRGGHFAHPEKRLAKGIKWLLDG